MKSRCVILASGAEYRKLDAENCASFEGRGVYYAATSMERKLCGENDAVVVGAGNSAGQAAIFLSETCGHVYLVVRGDNLRKSMSSYLAGRIERSDKVTVLVNSEVCRVDGNGRLERVTVCDRSTGKKQTCECNGVFVMIGAVPKTSWLPPEIARDEKGFIITGQELVKRKLWHEDWRPPFYLETSCPGIFAAGDARSGSVKRVASAVGEGSMAVAFVHEYLAL